MTPIFVLKSGILIMCYTLTTTKVLLEEDRFTTDYKSIFKDPAFIEKIWYASGFSHPDLPVITIEKPDIVQYYRWGFIPGWAKDRKTADDMAFKCLNAVSETIFEKPAFRSSIENRCLIIVNGFYEWRHEGNKTYPYFIRLKDQEMFYLGGLYQNWTDRETGEIIKSVAILTTAANDLMAKIHNTKKRMPLILDDEMAKIWLAHKKTELIKDMMKPFDEHKMEAWTISRLISDRHKDKNVPEIQKPFSYPELESVQQSLF